MELLIDRRKILLNDRHIENYDYHILWSILGYRAANRFQGNDFINKFLENKKIIFGSIQTTVKN